MTTPSTTQSGESPTQSPPDAAARRSVGTGYAEYPIAGTATKNNVSDVAQGTAEPSSSAVHGDPPARSSSANYASNSSSLAKSNSAASAGRRSIASHVSVSAIGTIPLGGLQLHRPSDPPEALDEEPPPPPPKCLENGDVFLILDLPQGFTVGIDTLAVTADSAKVPGFRDIPPGPHFLWVSEPGAMSRCGYWFVTGTQGETRVKQWDRYNEVLGEAASHFEVRNQKDNIDATYPRLIPHNYQGGRFDTSGPPPPPPKDNLSGSWASAPEFAHDSAFIWQQLTSAISPAFLDRITSRRNVREWLVDTSDSAKGEINFPESGRLLKTVPGCELDFLFPQDVVDLDLLRISSSPGYPDDVTPRVLGLLDNSSNSSGARKATEADIVGEFQFAFLTAMHVGNYSCLDQWWHLLLNVILRAHRLVTDRPTLCRALLQTVHVQLVYNDRYISRNDDEEQHLPQQRHQISAPTLPADTGNPDGGILDTVPRNRRRLRAALALYKRRLDESLLGVQSVATTPDRATVGHAFSDLEAWFWRYGWDLRGGGEGGGSGSSTAAAAAAAGEDDEDDDYAPVVVELDEAGREVGLVRWD